MARFLLRARREALGLSVLQVASEARCPAETVVHTELGLEFPVDAEVESRLAHAYRLDPGRFHRLALHAEALFAKRLRNSHGGRISFA